MLHFIIEPTYIVSEPHFGVLHFLLLCFCISVWYCMVSEPVCLSGWVISIVVYAVYASTKRLYVNHSCNSSE